LFHIICFRWETWRLELFHRRGYLPIRNLKQCKCISNMRAITKIFSHRRIAFASNHWRASDTFAMSGIEQRTRDGIGALEAIGSTQTSRAWRWCKASYGALWPSRDS
jgi:hypothetical protein